MTPESPPEFGEGPAPSRPRPPAPAPGHGTAFLALLLLLGAVGAGHWWSQPPVPPSSPGGQEFQEARARIHLARLGAAPRVPGTTAHEASRTYLVTTLEALGYEVEIQGAVGLLTRGRTTLSGKTRNVVAYLPAAEQSGSPAQDSDVGGDILVMTHYDSVEQGPGAGDAAAGVAAALEIARVLSEGPPLPRGIRFLFTDREEDGLLGATAFLREHPAAGRVRAVVNLEARGGSGPAVLFETHDGNRPLLRDLARRGLDGRRALQRPNTSSLYVAAYRTLPNDTDLTPFLQAGVAGVNLAFFFDADVYHTRLDRPERVAPSSLHHLGSQGLGAVRALAASPAPSFAEVGGENQIFFTLLGRLIVVPPRGMALLLLLGAGSLLVATVVQARTGGGGWDRIPLSLTAVPAQMTAAALVVLLLWFGVDALAGDRMHLWDTPPVLLLWGGVALAGAGSAFGVQSWLRRTVGWLPLWTGSAWGILLLGLVALMQAPEGSYLLVIPGGALALGALGAALLLPRMAPAHRSGFVVGMALLSALPGILLWVPLVNGIPRLLGNALPSWIFLGLVTGFLVALALPLLERAEGTHPWRLPVFAGILALATLAQGVRTMEWSSDTPRRTHLDYGVNHDSQQGALLSLLFTPDPWTLGALGPELRRSPVPAFLGGNTEISALWADAPLLDLPELELVESDVGDRPGGRTLRLRLQAPPAARSITLRLPGSTILEGLRVQEVSWSPGVGRAARGSDWVIRYHVDPGEVVEMELDVAGRDPITVHLQYRIPGIPRELDIPPRPDWAVEGYRPDGTLVNRSLIL